MDPTRTEPADDHALAPRLAYRPSLDGLRAVAVLAVFAYHLGYVGMSGGYLGVDVFFVLSGYLITSVLLLEHDATGGIGLIRFWGRRVRRLLPALLLVVLAVSLWVWAFSPGLELADRRQDLMSTLFYASNWHFISSTQSYWAEFASASPVRHTWSLAIEEQFYLVWPLILMTALWLGRGATRVLVGVTVAIAALSVASMALLYSPSNPSRAYYGTESRIHQLLVGALLGILVIRVASVRRRRATGGWVAITAIAVLVIAFVTCGDQSPLYYHGGSVAVALATAALVWGFEVGPTGFVARALGTRLPRGIGKISYGIYLWHWPVILAVGAPLFFLRGLPGSLGINLSRVLLTGLIATASYFVVERPLRRGSAPVIGLSLPRFAFACAPAAVLIAVAVVVLTRGTTSEAVTAAQAGLSSRQALGCEQMICIRRQSTDPQATVLALIGDSTARSLDPGIMELATRLDWTYVMVASDGCRVTHLLSEYNGESEMYRPCLEAMPGLYGSLISAWDPDVILDLDWFETKNFVDIDGRVVTPGDPRFLPTERSELDGITATLTGAGARMVFLEIPPVVFPRPEALDHCLEPKLAGSSACSPASSGDPRAGSFNAMLGDLTAAHAEGMSLLTLNDLVCPGGACPPIVDGLLVRYDGVHFTPAASRWLVPIIYERMVRAGAIPTSA